MVSIQDQEKKVEQKKIQQSTQYIVGPVLWQAGSIKLYIL